jgi:hypothetical protein
LKPQPVDTSSIADARANLLKPFDEQRLAFQVPSLRVIMLENHGCVCNRGRRF